MQMLEEKPQRRDRMKKQPPLWIRILLFPFRLSGLLLFLLIFIIATFSKKMDWVMDWAINILDKIIPDYP